MGIFVKINTVGVVFIFMILIMICSIGFYSLGNTEFVYVNDPTDIPEDKEGKSYIALYNHNYISVIGMIGCAFFLHTISLPIIRNNRHPENN